MTLHGKIVVIKRSGNDGIEFPLTATCLFGRTTDCDIRIQLPQVSKEHCRIDLNENKEVVLTNLSVVNPTRVNGKVLEQSERLKHGDVITVIDRSFRFEYPPAPTPRKRSSTGGKADFKVLQDQQVREQSAGGNRISAVSTGPQLKDGTNHDILQKSMERTIELQEEKTASPFNDLYQMIKKSLDVKTPRKSSISQLQTPSSRFCSPKPVSVKKNVENFVTLAKATPKNDKIKACSEVVEVKTINNGTPKSVKKQRKSSQILSNDTTMPKAESVKSEAPSAQKRISVTPQRFTSSEVIEQITSPTSKSTVTKSKEATPAKEVVTSPKAESQTKASARNSGNVEKVASKKRKSGELPADLPTSQMKRKRVSFGNNLSPELFDKHMPPDSPLRKGATPRRSYCLSKPKDSLLRRVSVIGMIQEHPDYQSPAKMKTPSPKKSSKKSPITQSPAKKSPKSKSASPKAETPEKKSPKSKSASPKAETPAKKSPKSKSPSPKAETPAKKSPKSKSPSPKAETPAKKSPKSRSASPKAETSRAGSSKSKSPSPFKRRTSSTKVETPLVQIPTIKGRFSVSRISTPSPVSGDTNKVCLDTVTPKLRLKRKSMKSTSRRSSVKVICRKSGISKVSMKAMNSWAEIVKFGQKRALAGGPAKTKVTKTKVKKTASKPQTPAAKLKDQVSTGHANSPVTIIVGRAHRQKISCPSGAAPKWINNVGLLKKDVTVDEDLTGISEMYKTPVAKRKQRSDTTESSMIKTPAGDLGKYCVEPSMLNTPEEPDEMMVSPLSVSTTVMDRSFNHEAVQRLFIGAHKSETDFDAEIPDMEVAGDSCEQSTHSKTSTITPKMKPVLPNSLTGMSRIKKTPRQKAEALEDLRGKVLKTPKQKIEHQECLTGVKRIMKTPKQNAEPLEDIRGKILKTPKQKIEQQECLTGIKRIMKTPKQNAEPLEDLRGKILKTPKQKIQPQVCLTGVKRIFSTPHQQAEDSPDKHLESHKAASSDCVDLSGMLHSDVPPTSETSLVCVSSAKRLKTPRVKAAPVEDMVGLRRLLKTPREKGEPVADNFGIKRLMKSPKLKGNAPVEDFEGLKELMELPPDATEQETTEVNDQTSGGAKGADQNEAAIEQVPCKNESSDTSPQSPQAKPNDAPEERLKPQPAVRGRRVRKAEAVSVEDEEKLTVDSEESAITAPVRGRRVKKTEATAPPVVQKSTRSRNVKSSAVEVSVEQSSTPSSKLLCKPKRGRNAKKASDDPAEIIPEDVAEAEIVPEPESEQTPLVNFRQEANENVAAVKPRRGRRIVQPDQPMPEMEVVPSIPKDNLPYAGKDAESNEDFTHQPEVVSNEKNSSGNMETAPQELTTQEITETDTAIILKKSSRVRRAKVELRPAEDNQGGPEQSESPVVAPGNNRRGKKAEMPERSTVRQTTRSRNAKVQESKSVQVVPEESVEVTQVSEVNADTASDESSKLVPHHKEAATRSTRARKTKQALIQPLEPAEKGEALSKEQLTDDDKPEGPSPTPGKTTRGKRTKTDDVQTAAVEEREHKPAPPVRAKRGRMAKQEDVEEEPAPSQGSVKNPRRTRKVEQDPADTNAVQKDEQEVSNEAEAPVDTEPKIEANKVTRSRRGQKTAQEKLPAESDDVQKSSVVGGMDKPRRGRGKQVVEVEAVMPEETLELKAGDENDKEPEATFGKTRRAKSVKNDVPETIPAKRARRGATLPPTETNTESPDLGSKSESTSKELPKRGGRRAAKPSADVAVLSGEELKAAVVEDAKLSMKTVKWKSELEVFPIQKLTPVKPVRGRKSKFGDRADADSQNDSSKTEEKDLSDKVEVQATKRARRGVKMVEELTAKREDAGPETQAKTRRARLAKK